MDFNDKVYAVVSRIPYGKVCTYGDIAKFLGSGKSSRMVGYAMNKCHLYALSIPAHRVVNRNGVLTGKHHFATHTMMQELLENEGLAISEDSIINFEQHRWYPH